MTTFRPYITGLATGVVTMCVVCAVYDPRTLDVLKANAVQIITIFATVGAAAVAYAGIIRQIGYQRELEEERRQRELEAERAVLPLALTRLCEICRRAIQDLIGHDQIFHPLVVNESLTLEDSHVSSIKSAIRYSDGEVRERLQFMLRGYQSAMASVDFDLHGSIQRAPNPQSPDGLNIIALCYRWAQLYVLTEGLFDYARGGDDGLDEPFPEGRIFAVLRFSGVVPIRYTELEGFFSRAFARDREKTLLEVFS